MFTRWFHPRITGLEAIELLKKHGHEGSFLARPSNSNPSDFTLSVFRNNDVTHIKIQNTGDFYDLYGGEKFASLAELIHHYTDGPGELKEKNGEIIELTCPLYCEEPTTERWYHGLIPGKKAETLLLKNGKNGSFLVRESNSEPGNYSISIRTGDQMVNHVRIRTVDGKYDVGGGEKFPSLKELVEHYNKNPIVDRNGSVLQLKQPLLTTRITASGLKERLKELSQKFQINSYMKSGFSEEFERMHLEESRSLDNRKEGQRIENRSKNRYKNILPIDEHRVILNDGDPYVVGSDYINANFIPIEIKNNEEKVYISTQGPLSKTVVDFWRMIWQENCQVIVMAINLIERNKTKCFRYWPENEEEYLELPVYNGTIKVQHVDMCEHPEYKLREFLITRTFYQNIWENGKRQSDREFDNSDYNQVMKRSIYHYQFESWPDTFVPEDPGPLLNFLQEVNDKLNSLNVRSPLVVHCSAGIGRTGTIIAIDIILNQIKTFGLNCEVDIPKLIQRLRTYRSGMVQSELQYQFIYKAALYFVETWERILKDNQANQILGHEYFNIRFTVDSLNNGRDRYFSRNASLSQSSLASANSRISLASQFSNDSTFMANNCGSPYSSHDSAYSPSIVTANFTYPRDNNKVDAPSSRSKISPLLSSSRISLQPNLGVNHFNFEFDSQSKTNPIVSIDKLNCSDNNIASFSQMSLSKEPRCYVNQSVLELNKQSVQNNSNALDSLQSSAKNTSHGSIFPPRHN